ncbi:MAG: hypothetical protein GY722_10465 [bacterium]|nr:hypothetical protein [bacterium]
MNIARLLRYLSGWRAGIVAIGIALALGSLWLAFDLSVGETLLTLLAMAFLAAPLLVVTARQGVLAEDRYGRVGAQLERTESSLGGDAGSLGDVSLRLDKLDEVVADAVRKPSDPTTLPWPTPVSKSAPILLLPSAAYHLAEIMPLNAALNRRGFETRVAVGEAHWARIATGLAWYDTPVYALPDATAAVDGIKAVVTMKDWAGYGEVVDASKGAGVTTFAKVEGAQDFNDADTPYSRAAYRSADHILCQGQNDFDALDDSRFIVGSSRLERLFYAPVMPAKSDHVVINLNFTYGVLEQERADWIDGAVAACERLGLPYTVALHPAERRARSIPHASTVPISRLLLRATTLVSRFSTVPFEAMARGIPFVYHNPHGEQVSTFAHGGDAFRKTKTVDELAEALSEARGWREDYRERSSAFFSRQVDVDPEVASEDRAADLIYGLLG